MTATAADRPEASPPGRGPWRALFIVAAILLGLLIVGIVLWLTVFSGGRPSAGPTPSPTSASPPPSPPPTPTGPAVCTPSTTAISLGEASGVAGATVLPIVFTNTSTAPCVMNGYPVVEFVGDGNGTQIGPSATQDTTVAPQLTTLAPGGGAGTMLTIVDAGNVCSAPVPVDGFRVITPGTRNAFFVATTTYPACPGGQSLLKVTAIAGP